MTGATSRTQSVQRRQMLLFAGIAGTGLVAFVLWLGAGGGGEAPAISGIDAELISTGSAEAGWVRESASRLGDIESRLRDIESTNRELEQDNARLRERLDEEAQNARDTIDIQEALIDELTGALETGAPAGGLGAPAPFAPVAGDSAPRDSSPAPVSDGSMLAPLTAPLMREFELEDRAPADTAAPGNWAAPGTPGSPNVARPLSSYVPAGSYAEAVVLAGADASAGVQSQGDPRPVLLRLTGPAYGAAVDGVASRSELEGCTVTGAAYGDLSSEKVYVRLQTLACAGATSGTVIETTVSGFVAGSGQAGVRGPVVSREGALVQRAFLSGVFSGIGQGVNQAFRPQAVLAGGGTATFENTGFDDIGRAGLGAGAGTAGQEVSDYLIRRAEQYQPVVQLLAGTPVTVVFLEGAWLDGRDTDGTENG